MKRDHGLSVRNDMQDRRIILKTFTGRWAGLRMIQGTVSQFVTETDATELPASVENVDFQDHTGRCRLVRSATRYVLYCEDVEPTNPSPDAPSPDAPSFDALPLPYAVL